MQSVSFLAAHFMDHKHYPILGAIVLFSPFFLFLILLKALPKIRGRNWLIYTLIILNILFCLLIWSAVVHSLEATKQFNGRLYIDALYIFAAIVGMLAFIQDMKPEYWFKTDAEYLATYPIPPVNPETITPYPRKILFFAYWVRLEFFLLFLATIQVLGSFFLFGYQMLQHSIWLTLSFVVAFWVALFLQGIVFPHFCKCLNCHRPFLTLANLKTLTILKLVKAITKTHQFQCPTCSARYTVNTAPANHPPKP